MTHLSKLSFTKISRKEVVTPVQRKRLNLLQKLELQIEAATAELKDEQFLEEITKWVRGEDGSKQAVIQQRPVRKWWWQHHSGAWMVTLKDGTKELPQGDGNTAIAIGDLADLVDVLGTVRDAVLSEQRIGEYQVENPEDPLKKQRVFFDRLKLHAFCMIAGFTGMRTTELLNLSWGDVGSRRIPHEKGQNSDVTVLQARGKGKERELVAMPEVLTHIIMLKNLFYLAKGVMPQDTDPVFFNSTGTRIASFKKGLAELLEAADLRRHRDGRTRDTFSFRHFYITQQLREGVGQHLLSRNVGTSAKMIDAYYSKVRPTDEAQQLTPDWMRRRPLRYQSN